MSPPETPGHSQASLAQFPVALLILFLGSWCSWGFVCALQESVSPVLSQFCNQSPLAFKVKFPGGSQSLWRIPRLGNLLWVLELLQQCKNVFGTAVLQFVGHLLSGSMVELMAASSTSVYAACCASQVCCSQSPPPHGSRCSPRLHRRQSNTQRLVWLSLCGVSGSQCTHSFVWVLWASLVGMGFHYKHDFTPPTILLGLRYCPWTWVSFFGGIQHSPLDGCSTVGFNFGALTGEDDSMSFYSAILSPS